MDNKFLKKLVVNLQQAIIMPLWAALKWPNHVNRNFFHPGLDATSLLKMRRYGVAANPRLSGGLTPIRIALSFSMACR
ncbi:MAG: hypothetical protein ABW104_02855 [Candidatus Thiodiazotropha sp. 6PLUC2]